MVNGLSFVSAFDTYPVDPWPPGHPYYGESTQYLLASGDYVFTFAGAISLKEGVLNCNDPLHGGAPNMLGVANIDGTGAVTSTCNSWTFSGDFALSDWVDAADGGVTSVRLLSVSGTANPPYPPGASAGLAVYVNRSGHVFTLGQLTDHAESTGVLYFGGPLTVQVEVTPGGLWYCQVFAGGGLVAIACGNAWAAGELYAANFGEGASAAGGTTAMPLVTMTSATGTMGTRVGPATCPHPPPAAWGGRGQVFWVR
jgi:hypothetical protein